jgi:hypothetical protein
MELRIIGDAFHVWLAPHEQLLAVRLKPTIVVPLRHLSAVGTEMPPRRGIEWRIPGTYLPGLIQAGTYYTRRGKEFWYVTRARRGSLLVLELEDEPYERLVLGVPDNRTWAERLESLIPPRPDPSTRSPGGSSVCRVPP